MAYRSIAKKRYVTVGVELVNVCQTNNPFVIIICFKIIWKTDHSALMIKKGAWFLVLIGWVVVIENKSFWDFKIFWFLIKIDNSFSET